MALAAPLASNNPAAIMAQVAALMMMGTLLVLSVVSCFATEELFLESQDLPLNNNQRQYKRTLSGGVDLNERIAFTGRERISQCFEIINDDELLNELTLRRLERQRFGQHLHRGVQQQQPHHHHHQFPGTRIGTPLQRGGSGHGREVVGGFGEQDSVGAIGGQFSNQREHDRAQLKDEKLELGHQSGSFSDISANDRKVFEADSKSTPFGKDKRIRAEEDSSVRDKEARFDSDVAKAEKTSADLEHDRKSSSAKLGAVGAKHSSGGFLGSKSN